MSDNSARHEELSTSTSRAMVASSTARPVQSTAPGAGTRPIGVSTASPVPESRLHTQARTRQFSPKPGHMNLPFPSWRNQFTQYIRGNLPGSVVVPISSQWAM